MIGRNTRFTIVLTLAASLLLASADFAQATTVIKATSARHWNPASTSVAHGTKVVWKNPTTFDHTVTAYGGGWSKNTIIASGGGHTAFTFQSSGTYKFRCRFHSSVINGVCSGMCGVVKVT